MSVPVDLSREAAQELARQELAKQIYREAGPGLLERVLGWLLDKLSDVLDRVAGVSPGGYAGVVVVLLLLVAAAIAIRLRVGPLGRQEDVGQSLFLGRARSSGEHRAAADAHASRGEWAEAVRERLRAVVRSLEERAVLEPRAGRTADEAAAEGGAALPAAAADLGAAARLFDEIWYGGRPAGPEADATLRELDRTVGAARPTALGAGTAR
jgi:hypothetical protein